MHVSFAFPVSLVWSMQMSVRLVRHAVLEPRVHGNVVVIAGDADNWWLSKSCWGSSLFICLSSEAILIVPFISYPRKRQWDRCQISDWRHLRRLCGSRGCTVWIRHRTPALSDHVLKKIDKIMIWFFWYACKPPRACTSQADPSKLQRCQRRQGQQMGQG